jgi:hypothetical protein
MSEVTPPTGPWPFAEPDRPDSPLTPHTVSSTSSPGEPSVSPTVWARRLVNQTSVLAPTCLLAYGQLRALNGLNGKRGHGLLWDLGHLSLLAAILLLVALSEGLRRLLHEADPPRGRLADLAAGTAALGAVYFVVMTLIDLAPGIGRRVHVPAPVRILGPLPLELGLLTLLTLTVLAHRRSARRPAPAVPRLLDRGIMLASPVLTLTALTMIGVDLDLLSLGAVVLLLALLPIRRVVGSVDAGTG